MENGSTVLQSAPWTPVLALWNFGEQVETPSNWVIVSGQEMAESRWGEWSPAGSGGGMELWRKPKQVSEVKEYGGKAREQSSRGEKQQWTRGELRTGDRKWAHKHKKCYKYLLNGAAMTGAAS